MSGEPRTAADVPLPGGSFQLFVTRLSFQGMIALGLLENPLTKRREPHPDNARMILDDLRMLRDKTAGNLDADEHAYIEKVIDDLEQHARRAGAGS